MEDLETLQDYDAECFPTLESALELDGLTLKSLLKTRARTVYSYNEEKQVWYEEILYAGLAIPVLVHGKSSYFAWEKVKKWTFHHAKKLGKEDLVESYFEVWVKC